MDRTIILDFVEESVSHPVLDVGNMCGSTSYIDFITMEKVTSPIMWGVDSCRRHFIVLKLMIEGKIILQTIFQRYKDDEYLWRGCGHGTLNPLLFESDNRIDTPQITLLLSVMRGETVRITEEHCGGSNYVGKDVCLFNQEKWDAAKLIQKNWKLCRYDPSYKMCERVQLHNLNDICVKYNKEIIE